MKLSDLYLAVENGASQAVQNALEQVGTPSDVNQDVADGCYAGSYQANAEVRLVFNILIADPDPSVPSAGAHTNSDTGAPPKNGPGSH